MDAARYFEEMHLSMSSQKPEYRLVLSVKVQDLGGADAYLELRQEPVSGKARVFYSTMGRQKLNFQLVRKGWQTLRPENHPQLFLSQRTATTPRAS